MILGVGLGNWLTMVSTALLVVCLLASFSSLGQATAELQDEGTSQKVSEKQFYLYLRPRLGFFREFPQSSPYATIYERYFESVLQPLDEALRKVDTNDWRRVRPTAHSCIDFLISLQVKEYVLSKPFEIIILDACLGWLHDKSAEKDLDLERMSADQRREHSLLINDEDLELIYNGTLFRQADKRVPQRILSLVYDYVIELMRIFKKNPRTGCHSYWLEAYNDFVEDVVLIDCEHSDESKCVKYGFAEGESDTYLKMIYESTVAAGKQCYNVMQKQIHGLLDGEFVASKNSLKKHFKSSKATKQSESKRWPREMIAILQLVSGLPAEQAINLGQCVVDLERIKTGKKDTIEVFTKALAKYAIENVDINDTGNDPNGLARYGRAMTRLCRPYTSPKRFSSMTGGLGAEVDDQEHKPFEFYNIIYSLVRITNHQALFGISKEQFEEDVLNNAWELLYLATFACQVISVTWGHLNHDSNVAQFEVNLRPKTGSIIEDWPIAVMTQRLPILYQHNQDSSLIGGGSIFGSKLKLFGGAANRKSIGGPKSGDSQSANNEPQPQTSVAPKAAPQEPVQERQLDREVSMSVAPPKAQPTLPVAPEVEAPREKAAPALAQQASSGGQPKNGMLSMLGRHRKLAGQQEQPAGQQSGQGGQSAASKGTPIMSRETIQMFKKLHGRYPKLSDEYKKIYPELANEDLSGEHPKELGDRPLFHDPKVYKSAHSLYNSPEWQDDPAEPPKRSSFDAAKLEGPPRARRRPARRRKVHDEDEDEDEQDERQAESQDHGNVLAF